VRYHSISGIGRWHLAGILPAVPRYVDNLPQTDKRLLGKKVRGGDDTAAGICLRVYPGSARAPKARRQGPEVIPPAKNSPGYQDALLLCPFDDGNLDSLIDATQEGRRHLLALEHTSDALALELEAIIVDRPGDVDCKHQSHIGPI
jgi:hypothetical protein